MGGCSTVSLKMTWRWMIGDWVKGINRKIRTALPGVPGLDWIQPTPSEKEPFKVFPYAPHRIFSHWCRVASAFRQ